MMEWTPPPDFITVCQGGVEVHPLKEEIGMDASRPWCRTKGGLRWTLTGGQRQRAK